MLFGKGAKSVGLHGHAGHGILKTISASHYSIP